MTAQRIALGAVAAAAILVLACSQKPAVQSGSVPHVAPSLSVEQASNLLSKAREERDRGAVPASLEYYERALRIGGVQMEDTVLREVYQMLDGLRITSVTGDRQTASHQHPPKQALQARVTLELGDRVIAAAGVPVVGLWASGAGEVRGENASDAAGMVTHQVVKITGSDQPRYDIGIDVPALPFRFAMPGSEGERLLSDARTSLAARKAQFEFLPFEHESQSRVLVLIDEIVFDRLAEESILSDRLTTALVDRGVRVVGVSDIGKSNIQKLEQSLEREEFDAVRSEYYNLCDYILYGRIHVRQDYENEGGGKWSVARGRVSLYSLVRSDIVASADMSDVAGLAGPDQPWIQSAEETLRKAAALIEEKLVPLTVNRLGE